MFWVNVEYTETGKDASLHSNCLQKCGLMMEERLRLITLTTATITLVSSIKTACVETAGHLV